MGFCSTCFGVLSGIPSIDPQCSMCILHPSCKCVHVENPTTIPIPNKCVCCNKKWPICDVHRAESVQLLEKAVSQKNKGVLTKDEASGVVSQLFGKNHHQYSYDSAVQVILDSPSDVYVITDNGIEHRALQHVLEIKETTRIATFGPILGDSNLEALARIARHRGFIVTATTITPVKKPINLDKINHETKATKISDLLGNGITPDQLRTLVETEELSLVDTDKTIRNPRHKFVPGLRKKICDSLGIPEWPS